MIPSLNFLGTALFACWKAPLESPTAISNSTCPEPVALSLPSLLPAASAHSTHPPQPPPKSLSFLFIYWRPIDGASALWLPMPRRHTLPFQGPTQLHSFLEASSQIWTLMVLRFLPQHSLHSSWFLWICIYTYIISLTSVSPFRGWTIL